MPRFAFRLAAAGLALALAACTSTGGERAAVPPPAPSQAPSGVTPAGFALPTGPGCAGEIARFQAVVDNDLATGHTTRGVHEQVGAALAPARQNCAAGAEAAAIAQVNATKARFGYR